MASLAIYENYSLLFCHFTCFPIWAKQASPYIGLGIVARKLREYAESRQNHQKALAIYIKFDDRYSQAIAHFQLGRVAEELGEMEEAKANYLLDLQINSEFKEEKSLGISLSNLGQFYKVTQDESLLGEISQILRITVEEVQKKLEST